MYQIFGNMVPSILVATIVVLMTVLVVYVKWCYSYWKNRNVPFLQPTFPYGNLESFLMRGIGIGNVSKKFYDRLKGDGRKYGGVYCLTRPMVLVVDPDMIKNILTKDFDHFVDRGVYHNEKDDPLNAHLFSIDGTKWRNLRIKLTPTFTSGKMKMMFHTMMDCCKNMDEQMGELVEAGDPIDLKEVCARLTTDVIGSCAFGIDCNSFKNPNAEFRVSGKRVFDPSIKQSLKNMLAFIYPNIARLFGIGNVPKDITGFFQKAVEDTVKFRKQNNVTRKDFLQLLIELLDNDSGERITIIELAAQAFLFFLAGFETSSTTMTFCLYELTKNLVVQNKTRDEINAVLKEHKGEITYDSLAQMRYLNQVINETLRKYPPVATLNRQCSKDYAIPGTDVVIDKGMGVLVPVYGLHHDPEYYPNPQLFDPDRFTEENKQKRHAFSFLPFGDGPRNCIGLRFGIMQVKAGLAVLIKNYEFTLNPQTVEPLRLDPYTFLTTTMDPIWLDAKKI